MRSFGWVRRVVVGSIVVGGLGACGMIPKGLPVKMAEEKDFLTDAKAAMDKLKGEYTLLKGVAGTVQGKVDEFLYIDDGLKLGKVQWKEFRNELESCWNTPFEAADNVQSRAVVVQDLAAAFKGNSALHELQGVKDSSWNAVNKVRACPQTLKLEAAGLPKKATDEAKAWAKGKLEVLNELRVLAKDEAPNRAKALLPAAQDAVVKVGTQLTAATGYLATVKQLGDNAVAAATERQITDLNALKTEAEQLVTQAGGDSAAIGAQAAEATKKITEGFVAIGKRK